MTNCNLVGKPKQLTFQFSNFRSFRKKNRHWGFGAPIDRKNDYFSIMKLSKNFEVIRNFLSLFNYRLFGPKFWVKTFVYDVNFCFSNLVEVSVSRILGSRKFFLHRSCIILEPHCRMGTSKWQYKFYLTCC